MSGADRGRSSDFPGQCLSHRSGPCAGLSPDFPDSPRGVSRGAPRTVTITLAASVVLWEPCSCECTHTTVTRSGPTTRRRTKGSCAVGVPGPGVRLNVFLVRAPCLPPAPCWFSGVRVVVRSGGGR
ncbi:hypothetical protein MINT15_31780 [Saccharomonospora viridis]|uniref:Uncharacterized protein n=1 Tax=Saccharomonospora viridis TaxID=1852 RepID=A0A837DAZ9_9PSEU|nr:hypothetical protein MINT15_31780 [Saccharomonospora viridis]